MKLVSRDDITDLEDIPNVGPSIAANLRKYTQERKRTLAAKKK